MPVTPVPASVVAAAVQGRLHGRVVIDAWRPAVQGAVGHVMGLRDGRGDPYVVKTFPIGAQARSATEVLALRTLDGVADVPSPRLVLDGELPDDWGSYVVMTRLPGARWADRRPELDADQQADLLRDVASLLSGLRGLGGEWFGSLVGDGPRWPTAWECAIARCDLALTEYRAYGGSADLAERIRRYVERRRETFRDDLPPAFCHHDVNGGNILVAADGVPRITGLVDFERCSWDDPLADLALTALDLWWHDPGTVESLVQAYGLRDEAERRRLEVHVLLLTLAEWTWVVRDQPPGWTRSAAVLDEQLRRMT